MTDDIALLPDGLIAACEKAIKVNCNSPGFDQELNDVLHDVIHKIRHQPAPTPSNADLIRMAENGELPKFVTNVEPVAVNVEALKEKCCGKFYGRRDAISMTIDYLSSRNLLKGGVPDCVWSGGEEYLYDTGCSNKFVLIEGTPKQNGFKHCPYCSGVIKTPDEAKNDHQIK